MGRYLLMSINNKVFSTTLMGKTLNRKYVPWVQIANIVVVKRRNIYQIRIFIHKVVNSYTWWYNGLLNRTCHHFPQIYSLKFKWLTMHFNKLNILNISFGWLFYMPHEILSLTYHWMPKSHIYSTPRQCVRRTIYLIRPLTAHKSDVYK